MGNPGGNPRGNPQEAWDVNLAQLKEFMQMGLTGLPKIRIALSEAMKVPGIAWREACTFALGKHPNIARRDEIVTAMFALLTTDPPALDDATLNITTLRNIGEEILGKPGR